MTKYDDALDAMDTDAERAAQVALSSAKQFQPDQYAQAIKRGQELNAPASIIVRNPDAYVAPNKYEEFLDASDSPATTRWLTNPDNAAVAQDDVDNLRAIEAVSKNGFYGMAQRSGMDKVFKQIGESGAYLLGPTGIRQTFEAGLVKSIAGVRAWQQRGLAEQEEALAEWRPDPKFADQRAAGADERLRESIKEHIARGQAARKGLKAAEGVGQVASEVAQESIRPQAGFIERSVQQGVASGANALLATLVAGPEAGVAMLGLQSFGSRYSDLSPLVSEGKLSEGDAVQSAAILGTLEALTEYLPGKALVKNVPGFGKAVAEFAAAELPGEYVASLAQLLDDYRLQLRDDITVADVVETLKDTTGATLAGGATQVTTAQIIKRISQATNARKEMGVSSGAARDKKTAEELATAAQASKLATRSPEKLEEHFAALKKDTGVENVYIEPQAFREFYQSDEAAAAAVAELTGSADTYYEAALSDSRIAIPVEKYVARIATQPEAAKLADHLSFSDTGTTAAEAEATREAFKARVKELSTEVQEAADSSQAIFDDMRTKFETAGYESDTAARYARLIQERFKTRAARLGIDAAELYAQKPITIQRRAEIERPKFDINDDVLIDRVRTGDIPSEREAFGESLVEFLKSKGGLKDDPELDARDVKKAERGPVRGLIKKNGMSLDAAAELAAEQGYISGHNMTELLAALDKELAGKRVHSPRFGNSQLQSQRAAAENMAEQLSVLGLDLQKTDNETIKRALARQYEQAGPGVSTGQVGLRTVAGTEPAAGWETATRILGKSGKPLKFHRGGNLTAQDFSDDRLGYSTGHPSSGLGVFFTNSQDEAAQYGDVSSSFLDVRNPRVLKIEDVPAFDTKEESIAFREKAKADGFDGFVISAKHLGGPTWVVAFEAEQVIQDAKELYQSSNENIDDALDALVGNDLEDDQVFSRKLPSANDESLTYLTTIGDLYLSVKGEQINDYGPHELFFHNKDDEPVGLVRLTKSPKQVSINMIALKEDYRGQGIGKEFYEYLLDDLGLSVKSDKEITDATAGVYRSLLRNHTGEVASDGRVIIHPASEKATELFQPAYHGSGSQFDKFLLNDETIGTGEGGQAFGWGLYFAENPSVAGSYKTQTTFKKSYKIGGVDLVDIMEKFVDQRKYGHAQLAERILLHHSRDSVLAFAEDPDNNIDAEAKKWVKGLRKNFFAPPGGALYQVDIKDEAIPKMIDLDASFASQTEAVKKAFRDAGVVGETQRNAFDVQPVIDDLEITAENDAALANDKNVERWLQKYKNDPENKTTRAAINHLFRSYPYDKQEFGSVLEYLEDRSAVSMLELYRRLAQKLGPLGNDSDAKRASLYLLARGIPGSKYLDEGSRTGSGTKTRNMVLFDDSLVTITHKDGTPVTPEERKEFLQSQQEQPGKRGSIQIGDQSFNINLFEKADLSTALHEFGHLFLEQMRDDVAYLSQRGEPANELQSKLLEDGDKILKWLGVESFDDIKTEHHEKFAESFVDYWMEGKAPSTALQDVFARFRAWLVSVYRALTRQNVRLTPQVRNVFDRLLATDDAIAAAEGQQAYAPIFTTAEAAGFSPQEWKTYKNIATKAHQEHVDDLTRKSMAILKKEREAFWNEERAKVVDEVTAEVNAMPLYRVQAFLRNGTMSDGSALPETVTPQKLNKAELVDKYGKGILKRLRGMYSDEGLSPTLIAELSGYQSGDALIEALAGAPPKKTVIEAEADTRMRQRHGDMMLDGSLVDEALQSVHTESRSKVLAAELKALNRRRREVAPEVKAALKTKETETAQARAANEATLPDRDELAAIKTAAANIVGSKRVGQINPNLYRTAEAKAARKAFEAAGKGKFDEAYTEKRRQILNHELFREAVRARAEIDKIVKNQRRYDRKATREKIAAAKGQYLAQIDALRERFDFSNVSNIEAARRDSLAKWVEAERAAGREVLVPDELLDEAKRTPYKALLFAELQGLDEAIRNIEHLAKTKDKMLKNRKESNWQEGKAEMMERAESTRRKSLAPPVSRFERSAVQRMATAAREFADAALRPETIIEYLDGGESGPWHDYFMEVANNAEYEREQLRQSIIVPMRELADKMTRKRRAELHDRITIKSLGKEWDRRTLISIALNMGNESNMERLLTGGYRDGATVQKFTPAALEEIKNALNAEDWVFIQKSWDIVDSLRPKYKAFQESMGGLVAEKIEPVPLATKFGTMRGGYWPAVYDPYASSFGDKQESEADPIKYLLGHGVAATKRSSMKERTAVAGPLLLDYETVFGRHIEQVITDITHREFVQQANRILEDRDLRLMIQDNVGDIAWHSLRGMVMNTVRPNGGYNDAAGTRIQKLSKSLLSNFAVSALGFKAMTAVGNLVLAPIQASARVSPKYIATGIGKFYRNPVQMAEFIQKSSPMMENRYQNIDNSYNVVADKLRGERGFRQKVMLAAMSVHRASDYLAVNAIWLGRYQQALDSGEAHDEAVRLADIAVRQTQTAGAPKDLSSFERDPRWAWFKMFMGPMVIMGNRIRDAVERKGTVSTWPEAFGALMATWFLPSIMWEFVTKGLPGDDDDDDERIDDIATAAARAAIFYPAQTLPFIRDAASFIERQTAGRYAQARMSPIGEATNIAYQAGKKAWDTYSDWQDGEDFAADDAAKAMLRASGPLFGMPSNQLDITGSFLWDVYTGEYEPDSAADLRYLVMRREK